MLSVPGRVRIYLYTRPADMRKQCDGLSALVDQQMRLDPMSGHLFVFRNRRGDKLKLLYWARDGYAVWYKRLEKGTFPLPLPAERAGESARDGAVTLAPADLAMLLEGVDLSRVKPQKRWVHEPV